MDGDNHVEDLVLSSNINLQDASLALAGSGKMFSAQTDPASNTPYVILIATIRAKDTPKVTKVTLTVSKAVEIQAALEGPKGVASMQVCIINA